MEMVLGRFPSVGAVPLCWPCVVFKRSGRVFAGVKKFFKKSGVEAAFMVEAES